MKSISKNLFIVFSLALVVVSCNSGSEKSGLVKTDENGFAVLTDDQVENIVQRSYQYLALYNVNNKTALKQDGWNTISSDTVPKDHNLKSIARPNNDTFYTAIMLDLRTEPMIINMPAFSSDYVSLMVTAYDHYVNIPKATRLGDFKKPEKILLYSANTLGYNGETIDGVDEIFKCSGDFVSAIFRVMPHLKEPERYAEIVDRIGEFSVQTLSEFHGKEPLKSLPVEFPDIGKTDIDIFENNLLEVMQFVMNHTAFDPNNEMDQALLAAYKPLGIEPDKEFDGEITVKLDTKKFVEIATNVRDENLAMLQDPEAIKEITPTMFQPKGSTNLKTVLIVSITGPIGMPMEESVYPPINTSDGSKMNALNDYIVKMNKDELPPSGAFWSITLYDEVNGFFIPNDRKKYSVGKNAGYKFNDEGGIDIYVAAEQPDGVPVENWLPINREDLDINLILRSYVTDLEQYKTWQTPVAEKL